jgi:hypothetical protein
MYIIKKYFPEVMSDNDNTYFNHLFGIIESVDELCSMEITKTPSSYHFRIATSVPKYNPLLLEELLKFHNIFKIKLNMSKSIKSSATLMFSIDL